MEVRRMTATLLDGIRAAARTLLHEAHHDMREVVAGLDARALAWHPPAAESNSISGLIYHALDSERFQIRNALDRQMDRDREGQFTKVASDPAELISLIDSVESELDGLLVEVEEATLLRAVTRGTQTRTGMAWLFRSSRHAQEHIGQAQLTRDLYLGGKVK
jgi:hypothetical protein